MSVHADRTSRAYHWMVCTQGLNRQLPRMPSAFAQRAADRPDQSLQLRVLGLGLFQDGDVRVSVFPEGEEVLVGDLGFGGVFLHSVGAGKLETSQRDVDTAGAEIVKVENSLRFNRGVLTIALFQVHEAADIGRGVRNVGWSRAHLNRSRRT